MSASVRERASSFVVTCSSDDQFDDKQRLNPARGVCPGGSRSVDCKQTPPPASSPRAPAQGRGRLRPLHLETATPTRLRQPPGGRRQAAPTVAPRPGPI